MITLLEFLLKKHIENIYPTDAVDLGLPSGTLWCSHNVGAEKPEDYGDYFAWGETETKKAFNTYTYKFFERTDFKTLNKYNDTDNKRLLDLEDDAAHVIMGEDWHIPTKEQVEELLKETTSKWILLHDISGREFKSTKNNNSIFIPAAGYKDDSTRYLEQNSVYLRTNLIYMSNIRASIYYFMDNTTNLRKVIAPRYLGYSVRGVIDKK